MKNWIKILSFLSSTNSVVGMGGVCSSGASKKSRDLDVGFHEHQKNSGFSGNLKKGKSSGGKQQHNRIDDESYAYPDIDSLEKSGNLYDSAELKFSISRELKPSTPARTPTVAKVCINAFPFVDTKCFVWNLSH